MAFITADRVKDTSTTTGTGNITVSGSAPFGYRTFSTVLSVADTFYYAIQGQSTAEWEIGVGTYASTNQFARTTVLASSASGSAVSFSSGTKNVFITLAATRTLQLGPSDTLTAGSVPYGTGSALAYTAAGTSGQFLKSNGAGAPTWVTAAGTGTVTSVNVSGGTTGLTTSGGPVTTSGTITLAGTLAAANGGTGLTSPGSSGNVLTSNGSAWVSQAGGSGTVTSVSVSGGTTGLTTSGGPVTSSGTITLAGTLAIANGGTNSIATPTAGTIPYGTGTALAYSAAGTSGQVLTSGGAGAPTWTTVTGTGTVTSVNVSGGTTGLTYSGGPITGSGTITMAGTLAVANGGTGITSFGTGVATALGQNVSGSGSIVLGTSPTVNNPTVTNYVESVVAIGTVTTTNTIALTNGTVQTATLTASTACTFTMPTATAGKSFVLLLKQAAATGNGTATFTGVKWGTAGAPTITATAGKMDILTFVADGTNWYGSAAQGYTP